MRKISALLVALATTTQAFPWSGASDLSGAFEFGPQHQLSFIDGAFRGDRSIPDYTPEERRRKEDKPLMEILYEEKHRFSRFIEILEESKGISDDLGERDRELTLFAPTDEAFHRLEKIFGHRFERHQRKEIAEYHIVDEIVEYEDMKNINKHLLKTMLKLDTLDGHQQRLRVYPRFGELFINMYARVQVRNVRAANGVMHIIDIALCPPTDSFSKLFMMPTKFSTFTSALQYVNMKKDMEKMKGLTVFAPTNAAWKNLGFDRVLYLFSPHGEKDLKRIVQYHIGTELTYIHDVLKGEHGGEDRRHGGRRDRDERRRRDRDTDREEHHRRHFRMPTMLREEELEIEVTSEHGRVTALVNREAKVVCTDCPAENGSLQAISEVLIPKDVKFPDEMHRGEREDRNRDERRDRDRDERRRRYD